jgi:hypothetical protein
LCNALKAYGEEATETSSVSEGHNGSKRITIMWKMKPMLITFFKGTVHIELIPQGQGLLKIIAS